MKRAAIHIFFAGDNGDDRLFADQIVEAVGGFANPVLHDVDRLQRDVKPWMKRRPKPYEASVFVLSHSLLDNAEHHDRIIRSAGPSNPVGRSLYYIARGTPANDLGERYPELKDTLFERVGVGDESQLAQLTEELQTFATDSRREWRRRAAILLTVFPGVPLVLCGGVLHIAGLIGLFVPIGVWISLLLGRATPACVDNILVFWSGYVFGWLLSKSGPHDFWPWLGRRWQFTPACFVERVSLPSKNPKSKLWQLEGCLAETPEGYPEPEITHEDFECALSNWKRNLDASWRERIIMFWYALIPAQVVALLHNVSFGFALPLAVLFGMMASYFVLWLQAWLRASQLTLQGFDEIAMAKQESRFDPSPHTKPDLIKWESHKTSSSVHMRSWSRHWVKAQTSCRPVAAFSIVNRRWSCPRDSVFISYAWGPDTVTSVGVETSLRQLGVVIFRDKTQVPPFSAWASEVAKALFRSTHVILIISKATLKAGTCLREVRLALLRWSTELLPAFICVVTPEDRAAILANKDTPPQLHFVLSYCACMSPEDAADPIALHSLITQRRRQGLWRDMRDTAFPQLALRRVRQHLLRCTGVTIGDKITPELAMHAPVDVLRLFEWLWIDPELGLTWQLQLARASNWLTGGAVARRERFLWRGSDIADLSPKFNCESAAIQVDPLSAGARVGRASWGGAMAVNFGPCKYNKGFSPRSEEILYGIDHAIVDSAIAARLEPGWPTAVSSLGFHMAERAHQSFGPERKQWANVARKVLSGALKLDASARTKQTCRESLADLDQMGDE